MNKILIALLFFLYIFTPVLSQSVNEKKIADFPQFDIVDSYWFKFDNSSGTYYYTNYDTTTQLYTVYSNKGNSISYNSIIDYTGIIDKDGNYYVIASNNIDTVYTFYLLKNGKEVSSYRFIDPNWAEKDGIIYFACKEEGRAYFVQYNTSSGTETKGKPYDEIYFVYYPQAYYEGEPVGTVGFTNDGKPYYVASLNNEKFLVIGDQEQKHYSDVETYNFTLDKNGTPVYFAKDKGKFYEEKGNEFVVQGNKEYDKFDYLYGPVIFDNTNTPVYIAGDSSSNYIYPQKVVVGNDAHRTYSGGIYDLKFSPTGKLAYIASVTVDADKGIYDTYAVIDGIEGKKYSYINSIKFLPNGEPLYAAGVNDKKAVIVKGTKEVKVKYPNVLEVKVLPDGQIAYVEVKYGNYDERQKDKYRVVIGKKKFGPFDGMQSLVSTDGSYILTDTDGDYAFIASKLIDFNTYTYESTIYFKNDKSKQFDYFDNVHLYKGKVLYSGSKLIDPVNYRYDYRIYYGEKQIGADYNSVSDFKFDPKTGMISYIGAKGKALYYIEAKL
jgi:hypothetical protein